MDFYKNIKRLNKFRLFIIFVSGVLLIINIYLSISDGKIKYFAVLSNLLLILAMIFSIKHSNKEKPKT
jgi:3-deoxy-D-manno-octulosonate 8-phosphate phosphatase KdsC-like HAD superfamily phosphatase